MDSCHSRTEHFEHPPLCPADHEMLLPPQTHPVIENTGFRKKFCGNFGTKVRSPSRKFVFLQNWFYIPHKKKKRCRYKHHPFLGHASCAKSGTEVWTLELIPVFLWRDSTGHISSWMISIIQRCSLPLVVVQCQWTWRSMALQNITCLHWSPDVLPAFVTVWFSFWFILVLFLVLVLSVIKPADEKVLMICLNTVHR